MPRPKVRPENRQRACHACQACKTSKIKCDSRQPCRSCMKRGKAGLCTFSGTDRRRRSQGVPPEEVQLHDSTAIHPSPEAAAMPLGTPLSEVSGTPATGPHTSQSQNTSSFRVKEEASSLLFLQFLRRTIKSYVGSVPFTDEELHHIPIDHDSAPGTADIQQVPSEKLYSLLDSYFEATVGILDLFMADEIDSLVAQRLPEKDPICPPPNPNDMAALDLALAIGAQSLHQVRLFALLSFYMLGACNKNAASMFLGIAAKSTVILGLHDVVDCQDDDRLGVLLSVRNLDILSSFILGKPKNLPTIRLSIVEINSACGESKAMFTAITNACDLLEDIVDTMVRNNNILHVPTAQNLLRQLPQWIQALPLNIQQLWNTFQRDHNLKEVDQQALMGILHISSVYYFTAILITRPFMVAYLLSRLRGKAPDRLINAPDQASDVNIKNSEVSILGLVCVNSAIYLVDTCMTARDFGFRFRNFCLLEVWVFGAGLVLGFAQFAGEPRKDINDSFDHACAILADIAPVSPQAQVYHEILCSFSQAVQRYKQRVADEAHQAVHQYIERIFRLGPAPVPQHCFSETPLIGDPFKSAAMNTQLDVSMDSLQDMDGLHALLDMARTNDQYDAWLGDIDYLVPDFGDFEQLFYTIG